MFRLVAHDGEAYGSSTAGSILRELRARPGRVAHDLFFSYADKLLKCECCLQVRA